MTKDKTQQPSNQNRLSRLQKFNKFESFQFNFKTLTYLLRQQSGKGYGPYSFFFSRKFFLREK
jgi:hypothetical protein